MTTKPHPEDMPEREAFEHWARGQGYQDDELARCKIGIVSPEFYNLNTENAYKAFAAGRASLAEQRTRAMREALQAYVNLDEMRGNLKDKLYVQAIAALSGQSAPGKGEGEGEADAEQIEAVIACLGDDAASIRADSGNPEDERAANMDEAATLLALLLPSAPAQSGEEG